MAAQYYYRDTGVSGTMKTAGLIRTMLFVITLAIWLQLSGCDMLSPGKNKKEIVDAYVAFRTALSAGDVQKAKGYMSQARVKEINSGPAADMMRLAAFMLPGTMTVMDVAVKDDKATLTLREGVMVELSGGDSAPDIPPLPGLSESAATGTVTFVREEKIWKLDKESWKQDMGSNLFGLLPAQPFFKEGGTLPRLLRSMGGQAGAPMRGSQGVAATPDGSSVIAIGDFSIVLLNSSDGREICSARMEHHPVAIAVTPDSANAITLDAYGGVTFWPLAPDGFGPPQRQGDVGRNASLAISRNGRYLATASFDNPVTIWDIPARKEIARISMPEPMRSVAFSPSGQLLAAGSAKNSFTLWDLENGKGRSYKIPKVDAQSDVSGIAISPDGKRLATSHMDSSITLWDPATQTEVKNFFVSQSSSWSVRFSPDSRLFATTNQGGSIHLWKSENGEKLGELKGQPSQPMGMAFSPDGKYLYTIGEKGEVAVWGAE